MTDCEPYLLEDADPTAIETAIAEHVSPFVTSGATLQTGIGGIPSMVVQLLAKGDAGDFGVHSEMFTTGLMQLHKAGKVSNRRKGQFDGFSVTTFAAGNAELYEWLDGNEEVRFLPVDIVNSPETISRNEEMVTINGALAVDLWGQVAADTLHGRQFSGIGGHEDFVSASGLELGDRAVICLPATATVDGAPISRDHRRVARRHARHHAAAPAGPRRDRVRRGPPARPHRARARAGARADRASRFPRRPRSRGLEALLRARRPGRTVRCG